MLQESLKTTFIDQYFIPSIFPTYTHTHARARAHTHARTHTRTYAHTHVRTHTKITYLINIIMT